MIHSPALTEFVGAWEGLRLEAYLDIVGVPTIGYGFTEGVQLGDTCTEAEATARLDDELTKRGAALAKYMHRTPAQRHHDALLALAFNCGTFAIGESGVMARFNAGLDQECADRFRMWNRAGNKVVKGLAKRREAERDIYLYSSYEGRP